MEQKYPFFSLIITKHQFFFFISPAMWKDLSVLKFSLHVVIIFKLKNVLDLNFLLSLKS